MTLNPEAMSMLSLFCDMVPVLAQLTNSAAHAEAILMRKRRVVGFMDGERNKGRSMKEELRSLFHRFFLGSCFESLAVAQFTRCGGLRCSLISFSFFFLTLHLFQDVLIPTSYFLYEARNN